jgi:hypothetical protein
MGIKTRPVFYYISPILKSNKNLDFDEGSGELNAAVTIGAKSIEQLMTDVQKAMNEKGSQEYTVSFDRDLRFVTISASGNFDLLATTGTSGFSILSSLGFVSDKTGANSYTSDLAIGNVYQPQFLLQDWKAPEDNKESIQPSVQESANGEIEVFTFGSRSFFEFNIRFINDFDRPKGSYVETNTNAISEARAFMNFITTRSPLEIMRDRDDKDDFETIRLERTRSSRDGVGFELREMRGLQDWFETGTLVFRLL